MKVITKTVTVSNPVNMPGFVYAELRSDIRVRLTEEDWKELGRPNEFVVQVSAPTKEGDGS